MANEVRRSVEDRTRMSGAYTKPSYELAIERSGGKRKERSPNILSDLLSMVGALRWLFTCKSIGRVIFQIQCAGYKRWENKLRLSILTHSKPIQNSLPTVGSECIRKVL